MAEITQITASDMEGLLSWQAMVEALRQGHLSGTPQMDDMLLTREHDAMLNRAAWIPGLGVGLKSVTVIADNKTRGLPSIQGAMLIFNEENGTPEALIDSEVVTYWKTAADSGLGAKYLARPDSRKLLIVGAGEVAHSLAEVYSALFPALEEIKIWSRTQASAFKRVEKLSLQGLPVHVCEHLATDAGASDIIACATMTNEPVLHGAWVGPGTHVDLVGAYRPDMREADDDLLRKARIFVDSRETTLEDIGEMAIPIAAGIISPDDVCGDLYDLTADQAGRDSDADITLYKNGGGAHLDLMAAKEIIRSRSRARPVG